MFGIGKLLGGVFNRLGLDWLGQAISIGFNLATGNWLALMGDVTSLVSNFKGLSFLEKFSRFAPLGGFGFNGGCFSSAFSSLGLGRADGLLNVLGRATGLDRAVSMLELVRETERNISIFNARQNVSAFNYLVG
jgi:hypothetical protein